MLLGTALSSASPAAEQRGAAQVRCLQGQPVAVAKAIWKEAVQRAATTEARSKHAPSTPLVRAVFKEAQAAARELAAAEARWLCCNLRTLLCDSCGLTFA